MEIKISIVIPVYNVEDYLQKCLDSIRTQTFSEFEVILVDDGSSDGTGRICEEAASRDPRFRVIHQENQGVSAARNLALDLVRGTYVLFFDGDDYVLPETPRELYEKAEKEEADSILYGYYLVENGRITETHLPGFAKDVYQGEEILEQVVPKFVGVSYGDIDRWLSGDRDALKKENTALWRSMIRTEVLKRSRIRFDQTLKVGEDTCFTTEYLSCIGIWGGKCCVVFKCYYHLVVRDSSAIATYKSHPLSVAEGKTRLLSARRNLTRRIQKRSGENIEELWYGTVVMSCIQLAFLLSARGQKTPMKKRYQAYRHYLLQEETLRAVRKLEIPAQGGVKRVPFLLLKKKKYGLLFFCTWCLGLVNYQFQR